MVNIKEIIIYTDGGSRGNPGPAAAGAFFANLSGINEYGEFLDKATNNEAEYGAVILALKKAKQKLGKTNAKKSEIIIRTDSELVSKQLRGEYKLKNENLKDSFIEIWNLKQDFAKVKFETIPRTQNKQADKIVNRTLDDKIRRGKKI